MIASILTATTEVKGAWRQTSATCVSDMLIGSPVRNWAAPAFTTVTDGRCCVRAFSETELPVLAVLANSTHRKGRGF